MTHVHEDAVEGALVLSVALAAALRGDGIGEIRSVIEAEARGPLSAKVVDAFRMLDERADVRTLAATLGTGVLAIESVPLALALFLRSRDSETAVLDAIRAGGDTDTIGAMVGALCGAMNGVSSFPPHWLAALEARDKILGLAAALDALSSQA